MAITSSGLATSHLPFELMTSAPKTGHIQTMFRRSREGFNTVLRARCMKRLLRLLCGDYALYRLYRHTSQSATPRQTHSGVTIVPIDDPVLLNAVESRELSGTKGLSGSDARGFVANKDGAPVAICWYWGAKRYAASRTFWPLQPDEAKLVHVVTVPCSRGEGVGSLLLTSSARLMHSYGFTRVFARVWHSNTASIRAFEKAGWEYIAFVSEIYPFGSKRRWRWTRWIGRNRDTQCFRD